MKSLYNEWRGELYRSIISEEQEEEEEEVTSSRGALEL